jgi:putative chitinase
MRGFEFLAEGGWDSTVTQGTVIKPSTVKTALSTMQRFVNDFNAFLKEKDIPPIKLGHPTGSSAYHDVDTEDKIYGDIDLQIIVPEVPDTEGKTYAQQQGYWYKLEDEFVKSNYPNYVHPESSAGHPIISIGGDSWVQIDLMPHPVKNAEWGRFRTTPERGVKGLLNGNMFSVLGELLTMNIQHSGVQFKVRDNVKQPYAATRKNYELVTVTNNIQTFVKDIFDHEYELIFDRKSSLAKIDPLLAKHPGSNIKEVKIGNLVNAVKGLARSFELNKMYGRGDLANFSNAQDFLNKFWEVYEGKALKDIEAAKRDKASTPEAQKRAADDRKKVQQGLEYVRQQFEGEIDEGWKDWAAAGALGTAMAFGAPSDANATSMKTAPKPNVIQQVSQKDIAKSVTGNPHEVYLKKVAQKAGIVGNELTAFLSQCAHETLDFKHMKEIGGSLDFRKYDPKYAPKKAKVLGNKQVGDGAKYKGRGYIQLTGRDNYKKAGAALGLPLEKHPEMVEKPEVAAKVAVWYWKNRVAPKVDSFKDTKAVTKTINPGLKHLDQRKEKQDAFYVAMK